MGVVTVCSLWAVAGTGVTGAHQDELEAGSDVPEPAVCRELSGPAGAQGSGRPRARDCEVCPKDRTVIGAGIHPSGSPQLLQEFQEQLQRSQNDPCGEGWI